MLTLLAIAGGLILAAGLAALLHAVRRAPEGREDELGFHLTGPAESPDSAPAAAPDLPAPHAIPHDCVAP